MKFRIMNCLLKIKVALWGPKRIFIHGRMGSGKTRLLLSWMTKGRLGNCLYITANEGQDLIDKMGPYAEMLCVSTSHPAAPSDVVINFEARLISWLAQRGKHIKTVVLDEFPSLWMSFSEKTLHMLLQGPYDLICASQADLAWAVDIRPGMRELLASRKNRMRILELP